MTLPDKFKAFIQKHNLFDLRDQLILAVSGGVDSVVLCELCRQTGYSFIIAHGNFQLRGEESNRDEAFVKSLGEKYGVEVLVKKFNTLEYVKETGFGIQEAARNLRYNWFLDICYEKTFGSEIKTTQVIPRWHTAIGHSNPKTHVVTAHHAGDSVETLLMNFFKGTGIRGLQGIQPRHELLKYIVRPLLFARKKEIINFAKENNLLFVEDSSNASDKYTRNYFRNHIIPSITKVFPEVEENLLSNMERFKDIEILYRQAMDLHKKKLLIKKNNEVHIPVLKLLKSEPVSTIVYELIKDFGFTSHQTEEVLKLLDSNSGKYISSETHKIIKNRKWIIITPHSTLEASHILINEDDREVDFADGKLKIEKCTIDKYKLSTDSSVAFLDAADITFPLLLRKWKHGDYFYPLGMKKVSGALAKKKLSKFFIDQKMSLSEKEKAWVIESNKRILWIVGRRIDDRFKITDRTKNIIKIQLSEL